MRARIRFLTAEEGGRPVPQTPRKVDAGWIVGSGLSQEVSYCHWSFLLIDENETQLELGKEYELEVLFVSPLAYSYFKSGDEILGHEGHILTMKGMVV